VAGWSFFQLPLPRFRYKVGVYNLTVAEGLRGPLVGCLLLGLIHRVIGWVILKGITWGGHGEALGLLMQWWGCTAWGSGDGVLAITFRLDEDEDLVVTSELSWPFPLS